jgi:hypothetical protein
MSKARDLANAGTALTTVSATELGYLDGVTSAIQTQINSKIGQSTAINPTIVDAKGDIIAASAADTVTRLAVGANDTVLTADSSTGTGLKWSAPASGGMTLIATATASNSASVSFSSIPATYNNLQVICRNFRPASDSSNFQMRFNGDAGEKYRAVGFNVEANVLGFTGTFLQLGQQVDNGTQSSLSWVLIPDYTNTTTWKMSRITTITNNTTTPADLNFQSTHGFTNITAAISGITFFFNTGNITSGTFELYGVK